MPEAVDTSICFHVCECPEESVEQATAAALAANKERCVHSCYATACFLHWFVKPKFSSCHTSWKSIPWILVILVWRHAGVIVQTEFWNPKAGQICQRAQCEQRFLEACKASGTVTQKQYAKPAHVRIYPQQDVFYNLNLSFFGINSWVLSLRTSVQWMPWPRLCPVSFQMPMESHGFFLVVRVYTLHWWRLCLTANTELYVQIQQGKKLYLSPVRCMSNFLFQFSMAAVQIQEWHQDVI